MLSSLNVFSNAENKYMCEYIFTLHFIFSEKVPKIEGAQVA